MVCGGSECGEEGERERERKRGRFCNDMREREREILRPLMFFCCSCCCAAACCCSAAVCVETEKYLLTDRLLKL